MKINKRTVSKSTSKSAYTYIYVYRVTDNDLSDPSNQFLHKGPSRIPFDLVYDTGGIRTDMPLSEFYKFLAAVKWVKRRPGRYIVVSIDEKYTTNFWITKQGTLVPGFAEYNQSQLKGHV